MQGGVLHTFHVIQVVPGQSKHWTRRQNGKLILARPAAQTQLALYQCPRRRDFQISPSRKARPRQSPLTPIPTEPRITNESPPSKTAASFSNGSRRASNRTGTDLKVRQ